jgi:hypothetical protein
MQETEQVQNSGLGTTILYNPFKDPLMISATVCPPCGRIAETYNDALFIKECGMCLGCDSVWGDIQDDYRAEMAHDMEELGLDPDDEMDQEEFNDIIRERLY